MKTTMEKTQTPKDKIGTIAYDRDLIDLVKIHCAKKRVSIRVWTRDVLVEAMKVNK